MKKSLMLLLLGLNSLVYANKSTEFKGAYFGQTPPDSNVKVFDVNIFNPEGWHLHSVPVFSPDGNEVYFSVYNLVDNLYHVIMCTQQDANGVWSEPSIVPFSGLHVGDLPVIDDYPFITPDGQQLFFCSDRLTPEKIGWQNADIFFVTRTDSGWSEPVKAGIPLEPHQRDIYPTVAANGNLYFTGGTTKYGLYLSEKLCDNEYARPVLLGNGINSAYSEWTSYIAPDENYYIFSSKRIQNASDELFISYKQSNGEWSSPVNMGSTINTAQQEKFPIVSPDGKYLFFVRSSDGRDEIYWVSAKIIYNIKKTVLPDPNGLIKNMSTGQRFSSIQCAINYANPNETIAIEPGIYEENFTLDKNLILQSIDPNDPFYIGGTIIQGDPNEPVVTLSNNTAACTLAGLTLRAGSIGIMGTATDAVIQNCRIMDNLTHGVELIQESNPRLLHCLVTANGETGINMEADPGRPPKICKPVIENCIIVDNGDAAIEGGEPTVIDSIISETNQL